jgi:hypothetical protein
VFDESTYARIHLYKLVDPNDAVECVVNLPKEAKNASRSQWSRIESDLKDAFKEFLLTQKAQIPG